MSDILKFVSFDEGLCISVDPKILNLALFIAFILGYYCWFLIDNNRSVELSKEKQELADCELSKHKASNEDFFFGDS